MSGLPRENENCPLLVRTDNNDLIVPTRRRGLFDLATVIWNPSWQAGRVAKPLSLSGALNEFVAASSAKRSPHTIKAWRSDIALVADLLPGRKSREPLEVIVDRRGAVTDCDWVFVEQVSRPGCLEDGRSHRPRPATLRHRGQ